MRLALRNSTSWPNVEDWAREFDQVFGDMDRMLAPLRDAKSNQIQGASDVHETESGYLLNMDFPGVNKEDINIECTNGSLVVTAERKENHTIKDSTTHRKESFVGHYRRSFRLPEGVDAERIEAHLESGVLSVALPKAEVSKAKKIEIGAEKKGFFQSLLGGRKNEEEVAVNTK